MLAGCCTATFESSALPILLLSELFPRITSAAANELLKAKPPTKIRTTRNRFMLVTCITALTNRRGNILFGLRRALNYPLTRYRHLLEKLVQHSAQMFGITKMRAHPRAQFRLVDKLIRMRAVLEWRLRPQQQ